MTMFERLSATYPLQLQSQSPQLQLLLLWQVGSALRRCLAMKNVAKRHINWRYCCRSCCRCFWHLFCASSSRRVASLCGHRIDVLCISGTIWTSERADYTVRIIMSTRSCRRSPKMQVRKMLCGITSVFIACLY